MFLFSQHKITPMATRQGELTELLLHLQRELNASKQAGTTKACRKIEQCLLELRGTYEGERHADPTQWLEQEITRMIRDHRLALPPKAKEIWQHILELRRQNK